MGWLRSFLLKFAKRRIYLYERYRKSLLVELRLLRVCLGEIPCFSTELDVKSIEGELEYVEGKIERWQWIIERL